MFYSCGKVIVSLQLHLLPAVCTGDCLDLVEYSRLRGPDKDLVEFFRRNQVSLSTDPLEADPRNRRSLTSYGLDDLKLNLVLGDGLQNLFGVGDIHVPLKGLAYRLIHDDCSFEAFRELAEGYAAEICPLRDCSKSSRHMDESSLEQSSSFRCGYRHLVHLDLGKAANHFHNIIGVDSTDGLENNSVGILLDPNADARLVR